MRGLAACPTLNSLERAKIGKKPCFASDSLRAQCLLGFGHDKVWVERDHLGGFCLEPDAFNVSVGLRDEASFLVDPELFVYFGTCKHCGCVWAFNHIVVRIVQLVLATSHITRGLSIFGHRELVVSATLFAVKISDESPSRAFVMRHIHFVIRKERPGIALRIYCFAHSVAIAVVVMMGDACAHAHDLLRDMHSGGVYALVPLYQQSCKLILTGFGLSDTCAKYKGKGQREVLHVSVLKDLGACAVVFERSVI